MTEAELWRLRENQAAYWEHKARQFLDDADLALRQAHLYRTGKLDDQLEGDAN